MGPWRYVRVVEAHERSDVAGIPINSRRLDRREGKRETERANSPGRRPAVWCVVVRGDGQASLRINECITTGRPSFKRSLSPVKGYPLGVRGLFHFRPSTPESRNRWLGWSAGQPGLQGRDPVGRDPGGREAVQADPRQVPAVQRRCGREEAVPLAAQLQRQDHAQLDPGARQRARPCLWRSLAVRMLPQHHLLLVEITTHHHANLAR